MANGNMSSYEQAKLRARRSTISTKRQQAMDMTAQAEKKIGKKKVIRASPKLKAPPEQEQTEELTPSEILQGVMEKINTQLRKPFDEKDDSRNPSYTGFSVPYHLQCAKRLATKKRIYEEQFQNEIQNLIAMQETGYEAFRLHRHLCISSIWPPLHNRHEINYTGRHFFTLTPKQRSRLNWLMINDIK